jgi:hypothetical protein
MLTAGALITLIFGLAYLLDSCSNLVNGLPFKAGMAAAAVMMTVFAGFYAARVLS